MRNRLASLLLLAASGFAQGQVLYNVNFNGPAQPVNSLVVTGAPPQFVSSIQFGSPMVVSSFSGLTNQPLVLDMVGNGPLAPYDQVQLNIPSVASSFDLSFDFSSLNVVGGQGELTVFVDANLLHNIYFDALGNISLWSGFQPQVTVGTYTNAETFHFDVLVNWPAHTWTAYKNGSLLGTAVFSDLGVVRDVRFSYGSPGSGAVGIDNVVFSLTPEPSGGALLRVGGALLVFGRLRTMRGG